jgi:hypothetical protein
MRHAADVAQFSDWLLGFVAAPNDRSRHAADVAPSSDWLFRQANALRYQLPADSEA